MKAKVKTYFRNLGFWDYRKGWDKGTCIYCGSEDKAGVNVSRDFYHCFVCEEKGSLVKIIQEKEGLRTQSELASYLNTLAETQFIKKLEPRIEAPSLILPQGYLSIRRGVGELADKARSYVQDKRGIDINRAAKAGLGYVVTPGKYFGTLIFPYKRAGKVIYFQGRRFLPALEPKIVNPAEEEVALGKSQVIYNEEALDLYSEINLVESGFNALTLYPNSCGLNGKVASSWQFSTLIKKKPELYNIILDQDAWNYAKRLALDLINHKKVRLIPLEDNRDVNDLGEKYMINRIGSFPILNNSVSLKKFINEVDNPRKRVRLFI